MIILIDGPSGSGKTTLAHSLRADFRAQGQSCEVISMDSIYEGWDNALSPSLVANLVEWVISPALAGEDINYLPWDWATSSRGDMVTVPVCDVLILEGVGSAHATIREHAERVIWVEGEADVLLDRVLARDGEHIRDEMITWQVREQEYFAREDVKAHANEIILT